MKSVNMLRMILIGMMLITTSGCKDNGNGASAAIQDIPSTIETSKFEVSQGNNDFQHQDDGEQLFKAGDNQGDQEKNDDNDHTHNCNPVPEPMTLLLIGPALIGLFAFRRKTNNSNLE